MPRILLAAVAVLLAVVLASGCGEEEAANNDFDQQFIDMMVPHHQAAVEMARVAEQRAQRAEIKELAGNIIRAQSSEIEQLLLWRREWYGSDGTPSMDKMPMVEGMAGMAGHGGEMATMNMAKDVEALRTAPEPFDRSFIDSMIVHHESAVAAGRAAETRAGRPEIQELAKAIIRDQEREISQLKQWRQAWFAS